VVIASTPRPSLFFIVPEQPAVGNDGGPGDVIGVAEARNAATPAMSLDVPNRFSGDVTEQRAQLRSFRSFLLIGVSPRPSMELIVIPNGASLIARLGHHLHPTLAHGTGEVRNGSSSVRSSC
jgi:hypothetical protein